VGGTAWPRNDAQFCRPQESREAGFVEHVIKPVNVAQLQGVIERVLASQPPA
jgi:hypothetical protein